MFPYSPPATGFSTFLLGTLSSKEDLPATALAVAKQQEALDEAGLWLVLDSDAAGELLLWHSEAAWSGSESWMERRCMLQTNTHLDTQKGRPLVFDPLLFVGFDS